MGRILACYSVLFVAITLTASGVVLPGNSRGFGASGMFIVGLLGSSHDSGGFPEVGDEIDVFIDTFGTNYSIEKKSTLFPTYLWEFDEIAVGATLGINRKIGMVFVYKKCDMNSIQYDRVGMRLEAFDYTTLFSSADDWRYLEPNKDDASFYSPSSGCVAIVQVFEDKEKNTCGYSCAIRVDRSQTYLDLVVEEPLPPSRKAFEEKKVFPAGEILKGSRIAFLSEIGLGDAP